MFGLGVTGPNITPSSLYYAVQLSSYSLSIVTTVLSAAIIAVRILMVSRMPGASCRQQIAVEIIVESAILYSISAVVFTPMLAELSLSPHPLTYYLYAEMFFTSMAVEFYPLFLLLNIS
jgi:hypothetical protein